MSSIDRCALPAVQRRSQETRDRLLDAAEVLLTEGGLDAATVPDIAVRAGVAVGSLYRRFPDKDSVLRAVYERFFSRSLERNREALRPEAWKHASARQVVRLLVESLVANYVHQRRLLAALVQFAEKHADSAFRKQARAARREAFDAIARLLLERKDQIGHANPEHAIEFVLLVVGASLKQLVLQEQTTIRSEQLAGDLTELVISYLRLSEPAGNRSAPVRASGARAPAKSARSRR